MFDKLATEEQRYEELMRLLGTTEVQSDPSEYRKHAKSLSDVEPLIERFREYKTVVGDIAQTEGLAATGDADMRELARAELKSLAARRPHRRDEASAHPQGSQRRKERHARNPRRHGRRRGGVVRRRAVPHVQQVRGA